MLIGYARVSTDDQNLDLQRAALNEVGCTRIYEEKLSGASPYRPELARLLDHLRGGDVVVVSRLDRLARSTRDLLNIAELIKEAEAGLHFLDLKVVLEAALAETTETVVGDNRPGQSRLFKAAFDEPATISEPI